MPRFAKAMLLLALRHGCSSPPQMKKAQAIVVFSFAFAMVRMSKQAQLLSLVLPVAELVKQL